MVFDIIFTKSYRGHIIYSFNPSYSIKIDQNRQIKLLSSYSKAFISPSLYQLYDTNYGNLSLQPENNLSFEFGFEILSDENLFNAVYFNRKQNPTLIFNITSTELKPFGGYDNSDIEITYSGVEFSYNLRLFEKAITRLNYIFSETTNGDLRSIPKHAFTGVIDIPVLSQTNLNLIGQFTGNRIANDFTQLEPYSLYTLQVNHKVEKFKLNLFFGIFNIFDTQYVIIPQYQSRGRNILMGLTVEID